MTEIPSDNHIRAMLDPAERADQFEDLLVYAGNGPGGRRAQGEIAEGQQKGSARERKPLAKKISAVNWGIHMYVRER